MKRIVSTLVAGLLLSAGIAQAQSVSVQDAWVRATVAQQKATGAFMSLTAQSASKLLSASSPVAGVVEIHEMAMDGNVMKMRAVPAVELPAGKAVELKPGGFHVMLLDLKRPLAAGETVPVALVVEGKDGKRETVEVQATVRAMTGMPAASHDHGSHDHGSHKH